MSLSMLKYMAKNYNSTRKMGRFYKLFRTYFTQEVIPISQNNKRAKDVVETMWGGRIVNLNDEATKCLTYILKNETTSNGMFMDATETKQIQKWQQLAGKAEMVALHNAIIDNMKTMWKMKKDGMQHYDYHVSYHHSKVTADYSTNGQKNSQQHLTKH